MALRYQKKPKIPEDPNEVEFGKWYNLEPKYRPEKSFYGKAMVMFTRNKDTKEPIVVLRSYETEIATCDRLGHVEKTTCVTLFGQATERKLSCTSSRHLNGFRAQAQDFSEILIELTKKLLGSKADVI